MELIITIGVISLIITIRAVMHQFSAETEKETAPFHKDRFVVVSVMIGIGLLAANAILFFQGLKYFALAKILFVPCFMATFLAAFSISLVGHAPSHLGAILLLSFIYQTVIYALVGRLIGGIFDRRK